ncbi:MAG: AbrB/MazE/SpoVT family DNA-binding domain-containing protein [Candidatus Njordarchaeia archaeon]
MEQYRVKIDKQGRIIIPSKVRKLLGLEPDSEFLLDIRNNTIILEPVRNDMDQIIDEWYEKMLNMKVRAKGLESIPSIWMSESYVKRKLGLD